MALLLALFAIAWLLLLGGFRLTAWAVRVLVWLVPPLLAASWLILKLTIQVSAVVLLALVMALGVLFPDTVLGRWVHGSLMAPARPAVRRPEIRSRAVAASTAPAPPAVDPFAAAAWHAMRDMGPATAKIHRYRSYRYRYGRWLP